MYLFVCLLTFFIASRVNLMYENITGVAMIAQYHVCVIVYTIFLAIFFAYKVHKVFHYLYAKHNIYHMMINLTAIIMCIGAFCPYTLNAQDILSQIHVYSSMVSCLFFLILLFIYTRYLSYDFPLIYIKIHWFFDGGIQFLAILTVVMTRVNGIIEILFSVLVCGYLYMIEKAFVKEKTT